MQESTDVANISFWNELCGSGLAKSLGIEDNSPANLKKFDDWYMNFYRYLYDYIPFDEVADKDVLEIGLGYGTLAQLLIEKRAKYHGLDIAHGPVEMANYRAEVLNATADIKQGSALAIPYSDETFDYVFTIGCLHHTGDLAGAIRETHRCLKAGGKATIMVYNALSYRHWKSSPAKTMARAFNPNTEWTNADPRMRKAYDANTTGGEAPETTFISRQEAFQFLTAHFEHVGIQSENIGDDFLPARFMSRERALSSFGSWLGLDLYITCQK